MICGRGDGGKPGPMNEAGRREAVNAAVLSPV